MKRIMMTFSLGFVLFAANAQQKEGRVVYERTVQMQMHFKGMGDAVDQAINRSRTDKLEVLFGGNQSLRRTVQDDTPDETTASDGGGGMQIRMIASGANDVQYVNFGQARVVDQREFATKNYIISDSIHPLNWKLTGETSTILNYPCQKAISQRIGKRSTMTMENGQMKQEQVADTSNIVVWFTLAIPVPAGPEYQGQLPGLILGIDINDGKTVYKAIELSPKTDLVAIKEPSKGKKVTADEFAKERDKVMQEMQKNMGAGGKGIMVRTGQ